MVAALLAEEKRTISADTEDDPQPKITLFLQYNRSKSGEDKGEVECYYCKKMSHTT